MDVNLHKGVHSKLSMALLLIAMPALTISCKQNSITSLEGTLSTGEAGSEISAASLVFSPTKLEFGSISANTDSAEQRVALLNRSKKPIYLGTTTYSKGTTQLGLDEETRFTISASTCPPSGQPLPASETCSYTVKFSPAASQLGAVQADLTQVFGTSDNPSMVSSTLNMTADVVTATDTIGNVALTFSPNVFDFPRTSVNDTSSKSIKLTNSSASAVAITDFTGIESPFRIASHDCPLTSKTLAAGDYCTINMNYTPTAVGSSAAYLKANYKLSASSADSLTASMGLTGSSITIGNSATTFSPTSLDFGSIHTGDDSTLSVTLTNSAGAKLYIKSITGFDSNFLNVTTNCPTGSTAFNKLAQCNISVKFAPQQVGSLAGNMLVTYDLTAGGGGYFSTLAMSGVGVGSLTFTGVKDIGPDAQNTTTALKVNWDAATGGTVSRYYVYHVNGSGQKVYVTDVAGGQTSYTDTGLTPNTAYKYLVKASDVLGVPDSNNNQVTATTDPIGTFAAFTLGTVSEGSTTASSDLSCSNNHSEATLPTPTFSIASQSDADVNCSITGSGPYKVSCTPAYKTGHSNWSSNVVVRCTLNGSSLDQTVALTVQDTNRAPSLTAISNRAVLAEAAMTAVDAADNATDLDVDGDTLTYSCAFDTTVDGAVSGGAACSTLPSTSVSFNTATGVFNWTPNVAAAGSGSTAYEVAITASDGRPTPLSNTKIFVATVNGTIVNSVSSSTANGTYKIGESVSVTVTFSGNVTVTGNPTLTLATAGSTATASYASGSGTSTLTFNYTILSGQSASDLDYSSTSALSLNGGTINDTNGNTAVLTLPTPGASGSLAANKNIVIDGVPPSITNVTSSTADGSYGPGSAISIQVTFSESVTVAGGTPLLTLETGSIDQTASYVSTSGSTLTFTYTVQSGDTSSDLNYVSTGSLALGGATIRDAIGNDATLTLPALAGAGSLATNKALVVDGVQPTVTSVTSNKADGSYGASTLIDVRVHFSEVVIVSGNPRILLETGTTDRYATYSSGSGTSILVFNYTVQSGDSTSDLDYKATNSLELNSGTINDAGSNAAILTLVAPGAAGSLGANSALVVDTVAPTVTGISSTTANGTYKAGQAISIQVTFGESVVISGSPALALSSGHSATYTSISGAIATFTYTVQSGDTASDLDYTSTSALSGGTIADLAGNTADLTLVAPAAAGSLGANKDIVIDAVSPTVSSVTASNANGTYGPGNIIAVQVVFSEAVTVAGGTPRIILGTTPNRTVDYSNGSGTTTLVFNYTVQSGDLSSDLDYTATTALSLNGATITDAATNSATLTLAAPGASGSLGANKDLVIAGNNHPPVLAASTTSQTVLAQVAITAVNVNDSNTSSDTDQDGEAITYSCKFDTTSNGAMDSGGTACASLSSDSYSFNTSTGVFNWTPGLAAAPTANVTYEIEVTGTDPAHNAATVYFTVTVQPNFALSAVSNRTFADGNALVAEAAMTTIDINDVSTGGDTGVTYSCTYDNTVDGAVASGTACTSLPGTASFSTSTGVFDWTPSALGVGTYEIKVVGTKTLTRSRIFVLQVRPAISITDILSYIDGIFADSQNVPGSNTTPTSSWKNLFGSASLDGILSNFGFTTSSGWAGSGTTSLTSGTNGQYRLVLDGTNDYIGLGTGLNSNNDITFDTWIRPTSLTANGKVILSNGLTGNAGLSTESNTGLTLRQSISYPGRVELELGEKSYADEIMGESTLLAYWRLGEQSGTEAVDSKNGFNGTYSGTVTLGTTHTGWGSNNTAVTLGASSGYVSVANGLNNTISGDDTHTIEFWVNPTSLVDGSPSVLWDCTIDIAGYCFLEFDGTSGFYWGVGASFRQYSSMSVSISTGSWYHIAVVKSGAGDNGTLYINGQAQTTFTGSLGNMPSGTSKIYIGRYKSAGYNVNGKMDEVAVYSSALSQARIQAHYYAGLRRLACESLSQLSINQWHHLTGAFSSVGPTLQLYVDGTQHCTQTLAGAVYTGSTNDFRIGQDQSSSNSWPGQIATFGTYSSVISSGTVTTNKSANSPRFTPTLVSSGLVVHLDAARAYYKNFPGVGCAITSWTDLSANAFTGTLNNFSSCGATTGWNGTGVPTDPYRITVNSGTDYVSIPHSGSLNINGSITLMAWIKPDNFNGNFQGIIGKGVSSYPYILSLNNGTRRVSLYTDTNNMTWANMATTDLTPDTWYHVAATLNTTTGALKYYLNGAADGSYTVTTGTRTTTSDPLEVGSFISNAYPFRGSIGGIAIYNRDLSISEISTNCKAYEAMYSGITCS